MSAKITGHRSQGTGEEIANSITHGVGAVLSVVGVAILVTLAARRGTVWHVVGCSVFGAALVALYVASTLYHAITAPRAKRVFRALDHAGILFLIAGTYTPFTLVTLRGPWGWTLLGVVWGLAGLGLLLEAGLAVGGLVLLALGGLSYTAGVGFYVWRRLPYHHTLWHGFVLAGSAAHFFAVLFYVLPRAS